MSILHNVRQRPAAIRRLHKFTKWYVRKLLHTKEKTPTYFQSIGCSLTEKYSKNKVYINHSRSCTPQILPSLELTFKTISGTKWYLFLLSACVKCQKPAFCYWWFCTEIIISKAQFFEKCLSFINYKTVHNLPMLLQLILGPNPFRVRFHWVPDFLKIWCIISEW